MRILFNILGCEYSVVFLHFYDIGNPNYMLYEPGNHFYCAYNVRFLLYMTFGRYAAYASNAMHNIIQTIVEWNEEEIKRQRTRSGPGYYIYV